MKKYCKICNKEIDYRSTYCNTCANLGLRNPMYGKKLTKTHKRKIGKTVKKTLSSPKIRKKISKGTKKSITVKVRKKMSKSHLGKTRKPFTMEHLKNMSESHRGYKHSAKAKQKMSKTRKGIKFSKEHRQHISESKMIHGKGFEPYTSEFNKSYKQKIIKRDNNQCQNCGITQRKHLKKYNNKSLNIHHIDYDKENCKEENLISLCYKCNINANFNRDYWYAYFTYIMENKIYAIL